MKNAEIPENQATPPIGAGHGTQFAISIKLFLALGFITMAVMVAGLVSILSLSKFQDIFDGLIDNKLPTLEDTAYINQLSVTLANRGASLILAPDTWARETVLWQVNDDAQWLEEIIARVSHENLSGNRKQDMLALRDQLFETYKILNALSDSRIEHTRRLSAIDDEIYNLQRDLVATHIAADIRHGGKTAPVSSLKWVDVFHEALFAMIKARRTTHATPLNNAETIALADLTRLTAMSDDLPKRERDTMIPLLKRLMDIATGPNGLFTVKNRELEATIQIEAALRNASTIAEQFMSASELATTDIRQSITETTTQMTQSMTITIQLLVGIIVISTLIALATFLYVSRTVLRRLGMLRRSMVAHADGTTYEIDTSGNDEITDMALSLQYLVDTLQSRETGLRHAKDEAEQASVAKTRFLAAASHDLRQPLQALNLFTYALEGKEKDPDKLDIIKMIRNSLDSLKELLNTLLDISKLEAGVIQPNIRNFPVSSIMERIRSELTAVAWAHDLELRTVSSSCVANSDPSLLETIIRNLVDNAIKYTEQGRVLLGCRRRGQWLRIEVWDTGLGIAEDQRQLIFQDFYQIENEARKRTQGLGLGLAIVRRMANLLGCKIDCQSVPGKGSMFWVEVPMANGHDNPVSSRQSHVLPNATNENAAHIVIFEDDDQVMLGLKSLLETEGYSTIVFQDADPEKIEAAFQDNPRLPDLIIADYRLEAKTTGSEAVALIRSIINAETPAIIITGDTAPERLREARQSGFPILHKPIRPEELIGAIRLTLASDDDAGQRD